MHGNKKKLEEAEYIRKGPWKAEEDEVLVNHVNKYGPRDWSSIRSNGLLQRTGKSCRLRWVNKLRPNLKNGCKFTLEEERVVIELQGQFGNKWAKIASYLPGRTDNDVKNFWSSRQKRLARILHHASSSSTTSKSQKNKTKVVPAVHDVPTLEAPKFSSSSEGEPSSSSSQPMPCSFLSCFDYSEVIKMVPLPDLIQSNNKLPSANTNPFEQDLITPKLESYKISTEHTIPFPPDQNQQEIELLLKTDDPTFSMERQDLLTRIDDPNFVDVFGCPLGDASFFEPSCRIGTRDLFIDGPANCDNFFDDFPVDMFDQLEPPSSIISKL